MGHSRAFSVGTSSAPLASAPFAGAQSKNPSRPLVVNGSGLKAIMNATPTSPPTNVPTGQEDITAQAPYLENPLQINTDLGLGGYPTEPMQPPQKQPQTNPPHPDRPPVVVNGSNMMNPGLTESSFRERIANLNASYMNAPDLGQELHSAGASRPPRPARQPQNGVIAPLDLAIGENRMDSAAGLNVAHLSPVYETRTPSPTALRKFDMAARGDKQSSLSDAKSLRPGVSRAASKVDDRPQEGTKAQKPQKPTQSQQSPKSAGGRENGHVRGKSDLDGVWQKAGKNKKKSSSGAAQGHAEQLPKHDSERKGG